MHVMASWTEKYQYIPSEICSTLKQRYNITTDQVYELQEHFKKTTFDLVSCDNSSSDMDISHSMRASSRSDMSVQSLLSSEDALMSSKEKLMSFSRQGMDWDYTKRVYSNLRLAEIRFSIKSSNILTKSPELSFEKRSLLIDWLHEVSQEYDLKWQTLLLGVQIIDHYLQKTCVAERFLQLVGMTALLISAKMEEVQPLSGSQLVYISDHSYNIKELIRMEQKLLNVLEWNVTFPTPYDFLSHLFVFFNNDKSIEMHSKFFIDIFLQEQSYLFYDPSEVAAGALLMAVLYDRKYKWSDEVVEYTGFSHESLYSLCRQLNLVYGHCQFRTRCKAAFHKHTRDAKKTIHRHLRWRQLLDRYSC